MKVFLIAVSVLLLTDGALSKSMEIVVQYDYGRIDIFSYRISDKEPKWYQGGNYSISILNENYDELYTATFDIPLMVDIPPDPSTGTSYQIKLNKGSAVISLPYFQGVGYIKVLDKMIPIHKIPYASSLMPPPTEVIYGGCSGSGCFDLLLVSDGYANDISRFKMDANSIADLFVNMEPYRSNLNKLRITRVDNTRPLNCYHNCNGHPRLICCSSAEVFSAVSGIDYDEILVITNTDEYGGSGYIDVSMCADPSSYAVTFRDIRNYAGEVAVHETGHSFGGLWDEYEYGIDGSGEGPNCVYDPTCSKWRGTNGTGCYSGCSYNGMYRPTENSCLMRTLTPTGGFRFCPVCKGRISHKLNSCFSGSCTPDCSGKECGDDGCGGICGSCNSPPADYCKDLTTLRDYSPYGNCIGNKCNYSFTDKKCGYICEQNRCVSGSTDGGADISDGDTIILDSVIYPDAGVYYDTGIDAMDVYYDTDIDVMDDIKDTGQSLTDDEVASGCSCNIIR